MKVCNLLSVFAITTLAVLSQAQLGWTANYRMQLQPPDTYSDMQPEPPGEAYSTKPELTAADCGVDDCCSADACCSTCGCYRWQFFGEFLYLRPMNASVEYAVPFDGPVAPGEVPIQMGRTAAVNPNFSAGFRAGGAFWLDDYSAVSITFTRHENSEDDAIIVNPPLVIRSMVVHPSTLDAAADWLTASAHQYIHFDLADIDFRYVFYCDDCSSIVYSVGLRYASLEQQFDSQFESIIREYVNTNVNFEGGGFRFGLEAERVGIGDVFLYGKSSASFMGGEFRGNYMQYSTNDPLIVYTNWKEARFVSILDCELGIGWTGYNGQLRASAGYMISGWLNVVKTAEFISAVQANHYHGPDKIEGNGLVYDGFVAHIELLW